MWLDDLSWCSRLARSSPIRRSRARLGRLPSTVHRRCIQCVARRSFPALEACPQLADPMSSVNHNHNPNHQSQSKAPGSCPAKGPQLASSHSRPPSTVDRAPSLYPMCGSTIFPCARGLPAARRSDVRELASAVCRPPCTVLVSNVWLDDLSLRSRLARSSPIRRSRARLGRPPSLYPMYGSTIFPCARGLPAARRSDVPPPSTVVVSNVWLDDLSLRSRLAHSSPIRRLA